MLVKTNSAGKKVTFKTEDERELFVFDLNKFNYKKLSNNNRTRTVLVPAPRGIIFDRLGRPLVRNVPVFEITRIEMPEVDFRIVCSKGTYIRALARDFGQALQSGAYMSALCRTRVGPHLLSNAHEVEELKTILRAQYQPEA